MRRGQAGQLLGRQGACVARARCYEPGADRRQGAQHRVRLLVGQDRGDDRVVVGRETRQQVADPGEVVRSVPDLERPLAAALQAARQRDRVRGVGIDRPAEVGLGGRDREGEIRRARQLHAGGAVRPGELLPFRVAQDDGGTRRDDRQLLGCDRLTRVPQDLDVVERDVRQHDDRGGEHVRRVVAPAEACLDDRDVDLLARELGERRRGQHLELRRALGVRPDARDRHLEVGVEAVELDPLRPGAHVRRDVRAHVQALGAEQRGCQERRRRLAVRADDVDRRVAPLRLAEIGEQPLHPPEAELLGPGRERLQPPTSRRSTPAHGGSGRASRARRRRRARARSARTARSQACPRRARSPSAGARARLRRRRSPSPARA